MKGKIFNFIAKANQVLFFTGMLVFIGFFLVVTYSFLLPSKYEKSKVQIIEQEIGKPKVEVVYVKEYVRKIKGIHIFKILANTINSEYINKRSRIDNFSSSKRNSNRNELVNIIFVDGSGNRKKLFKSDHLIKNLTFANFKVDDNPTNNIRNLRDQDFYLDKNIYSVFTKDSNNDGFLSSDDAKSLYLSDYNGENLKLIFDDILRYRVIASNKLLIEMDVGSEVEFYLYDINLMTQIKLNTSIN
jgi:hypothetical protein